jgi:hypothetical protein
MRKSLKYGGLVVVLLLIVLQFVRPDLANPPVDPSVTFEAVAKPNAEVAAIVQRACYDCHSHNTTWPWYSRIAPVSWLMAKHVKEGRAHLNFSQWNLFSAEMSRIRLKEACQQSRQKEMPLWNYLLLHPQARLTEKDMDILCQAATQNP